MWNNHLQVALWGHECCTPPPRFSADQLWRCEPPVSTSADAACVQSLKTMWIHVITRLSICYYIIGLNASLVQFKLFKQKKFMVFIANLSQNKGNHFQIRWLFNMAYFGWPPLLWFVFSPCLFPPSLPLLRLCIRLFVNDSWQIVEGHGLLPVSPVLDS